MALIWFLACGSLARHPTPTDPTRADHRRTQISPAAPSPSPKDGRSGGSTPSLDSVEGDEAAAELRHDRCASLDGGDFPKNLTQCNETSSDDSREEDGSEANLARDASSERPKRDPPTESSSSASRPESHSIPDGVSVAEKITRHVGGAGDEPGSLKRVFLSDRSIVCNDGSQAGFYLKKSPSGSDAPWIVFLEGGWYCFDGRSCRDRWMRLRHLMTSSQWPETREAGGMLSGNPTENPHWHSANRVLVPYCSSDSWAGTSRSSAVLEDNFHFMGKLIVNQVIKELIPLGLRNSSQLILAGSSAGGTGVMLNLDPVQHLLHSQLRLRHIQVRGVSDSGWFLDRTPYSPNTLPAVDAIKKGHTLWQGSPPKRCVTLYQSEPWRCYFGYRLYPTIKAPLFVFQWLFDEAQMTADNVGSPSTPQQWDYIHRMGNALRASFANVSAVFAPSCVSHSVLTSRNWLRVEVDGVSVAEALQCWETDTARRRGRSELRNGSEGGGSLTRRLVRLGGKNTTPTEEAEDGSVPKIKLLNSHIRLRNKDTRDGAMKQNRNPKESIRCRNLGSGTFRSKVDNHRRNPNKRTKEDQRSIEKLNPKRDRSGYRFRKRKKKPECVDLLGNSRRHGKNRMSDKKIRNETVARTAQLKGYRDIASNRLIGNIERQQRSLTRSIADPSRCRFNAQRKTDDYASGKLRGGRSHRRIERCSWPQCNRSCPLLLDPHTGEEVRFMDMLKSFGLEMDSVAKALGVDMHTLDNMDHATLLNLLTQQTDR